MNGPENTSAPTPEISSAPPEQPAAHPNIEQLRHERREARRWWIKLLVQPALILITGALLLAGLGLSQKLGWISGGTGGDQAQALRTGGAARQVHLSDDVHSAPVRTGQVSRLRHGTCSRRLPAATAATRVPIQIDPAARRVADIHTVAVKAVAANRTVRAIGELSYDEGMLKTISAYVDGRIERLYADYTGVVVQQGDHLALIYSPRLYSGQVEFLLAKKNAATADQHACKQMIASDGSLQESARQRLIEFGMTEAQIAAMEKAGEANSRLHCAPQ